MRSEFLFALALFMLPGISHAEYFGEFDSDPVGTFINDTDRPLFKLQKPITFTDPNKLSWTAPADEIVDGASIPQIAWSIIGGPFSGNYLRAAIVHDYFCCSKSRDYHDTHKAFWRGLRLDGIGSTKAYVMWAAVRAFGPEYWTVDPTLEPRSPCKGGDSVLVGMNAQTNGIAAGKLIAMARTLETTNGAILDVVNGEPLKTGSEQAENHLDFLRSVAQKGFDAPREMLGLFSAVTQSDLELLSADSTDKDGLLIWNLDSVPELVGFINPETRTKFASYKAENLTLSNPQNNIFQEAFWMPAYEALYRPTIENRR